MPYKRFLGYEKGEAIYENAHTTIRQVEGLERNNGYLERHRKATERVNDLEALKKERQNKNHTLEGFINKLESSKCSIDEFDKRLWMVAVDKVTIMPDGRLVFCFKDGTVI